MKRDMDLARKILLAVEDKEDFVTPIVPSIEGYDKKQIYYHNMLLIQAGLAKGIDMSKGDGEWNIITLTSLGHDFLDASRNDTIWQKAKDSIQSKGLSLTFDLLKLALSEAIKSQFKG